MSSPNFKFVVFQKDLNKDTIIVNKEVKFNFNNKYLSSDQINKKSKVIKWSNQVLRSIENQLPVPRMYFSSIPKNINEYKTSDFELINYDHHPKIVALMNV